MKTNIPDSTFLHNQCSLRAPVAFALASLLGIFIFHLLYAWQGFSLYRDQHIGAALIYARDGLDLLRPMIVGFNANGAPTPQEFPLWQAIAALPLRWFSEWFGWANIVSLLIFCTVLFPTYQLGKKLGTFTTGWWAVALFLSQPIIWVMSGKAGADGTSIVAAIWFFYSGQNLLDARSGRERLFWLVGTALFAALAATLKLPFMMAAGLALGLTLMFAHRKDLTAWITLGIAATFAGGVFLLWTRYTDTCIAQAEFPFVDLRVSTNPEMIWWYFGDWAYRLNPAHWIKGAWRIMNCIFGSFTLAALPILAFGLRRISLMAGALLAGALITTGIFSHLVLHHSNYYLMYSLPVALLLAPLAEEGWNRLSQAWRYPQFLLGLAGIFIIGTAVIQGLSGMKTLTQDPYKASITKRLREHTAPGDKLLIIGGGWGGDFLILSKRQGLSIWNTEFLEKDDNLKKLRTLGFNKLITINESPLITALQVTNPGNEHYQRKTYETTFTSAARSLPTIYQDKDILIKQLPE